VRIRRALAPGGTYLMVEPKLSERLADNVAHPFARLFYGMSCLHCVPQSIAQGGPGLGACWGEGRARVLAETAGFTQFRALPIRSPSQAFYELRPERGAPADRRARIAPGTGFAVRLSCGRWVFAVVPC
jgi:hypothetical protein